MSIDDKEHRKLAAIMFTDMVGYSALAQRNEALALELLEEHRRLLRPIFPRFNGREIETAGDAFLVEFASALEATRCAVEIQRVLSERNQVQPAERQIRLRIGIHVGDVVHKDGKVMGDAVNIAARIEPLAEPGGICISNAVFEQVQNKIELALVRLDEPELKNIEVPVIVFKVVLDGSVAADVMRQQNLSRSHERRDEYGSRQRWKMAFTTSVFLLIVLNVFLFVKFGLRSNEKEKLEAIPHFKFRLGTSFAPRDKVELTNEFLLITNFATLFPSKALVVIPVPSGQSSVTFLIDAVNDSLAPAKNIRVSISLPREWNCSIPDLIPVGSQHFLVTNGTTNWLNSWAYLPSPERTLLLGDNISLTNVLVILPAKQDTVGVMARATGTKDEVGSLTSGVAFQVAFFPFDTNGPIHLTGKPIVIKNPKDNYSLEELEPLQK